MNREKKELIVALDVDNLAEARKLVNLLFPTVKLFKVGMQLFTAVGPRAVEMIKQKKAKVFLDLKFYDIPNTVANAVTQATSLGVSLLDVHISGGEGMLRAAVSAARLQAKKLKRKVPLILGITVLTSQKNDSKTKQLVLTRAILAKKCGLDGVVASVLEAGSLRKKLGKNFLIVTPGIRLNNDNCCDQKRVATPRHAIVAGSNYLVVGRPIVKDRDPLKVTKEILKQIKGC